MATSILQHTTLGVVRAGVVAAPITSGDTAFRGTADRRRHLPHRTAHAVEAFRHRPAAFFVAGYLITRVDFTVVWRYFAWTDTLRHDRAGRRRMALRREAQLFRRIAACRVHDLHLCACLSSFRLILRHGEPSGSLRLQCDRSRPLFHSVNSAATCRQEILKPHPTET